MLNWILVKVIILKNNDRIMPKEHDLKKYNRALIFLFIVIIVLSLYITQWALIGPYGTILFSIELGALITLLLF